MDDNSELSFIESLGFPGKNYCILNPDEYVYSCGSQIIIKEFVSSGASNPDKKDYSLQK